MNYDDYEGDAPDLSADPDYDDEASANIEDIADPSAEAAFDAIE